MNCAKWLLVFSLIAPGSAFAQDAQAAAPFGDAAVYKPVGPVKSMTIFLSGDGGWNLGVIPMARTLVGEGALVVGVNTPKFLASLDSGAGSCTDPSGALLSLARQVAKENKLPPDTAPILVGYSSGATVAYAVLVQAQPSRFKGGIGLGFCPDLESTKPMCPGAGLAHVKNPKARGFVYGKTASMSASFVALQGGRDKVCDPAATDAFIHGIKGASVIDLPNVGHGFSVPKNWMPQYIAAYRGIAGASTP